MLAHCNLMGNPHVDSPSNVNQVSNFAGEGGFIVCNNKKFCGDSLGRPSGRDLVEILNSVLTCIPPAKMTRRVYTVLGLLF